MKELSSSPSHPVALSPSHAYPWQSPQHDLAEARRLIEWLKAEADRSEGRPCSLADLLNNIGWSELLIQQAGRASDPVVTLTRALAAAEAVHKIAKPATNFLIKPNPPKKKQDLKGTGKVIRKGARHAYR